MRDIMQKFIIIMAVILIFSAGCTTSPKEGDTVEITQTGFVPKVLKVSVGDTVTFVNRDVKSHWPASADHPTHAGYPEEGGCIGSKFDSCGPLKTGEIFYFKFNQKGTWSYHDHIDSSLTGTVIVE